MKTGIVIFSFLVLAFNLGCEDTEALLSDNVRLESEVRAAAVRIVPHLLEPEALGEKRSCGVLAKQSVPVIQADWVRFISDSKKKTADRNCRYCSDGFGWLDSMNSAKPDDGRQLTNRAKALGHLAGRSHWIVFLDTLAEAGRVTGPGKFEGGAARGFLVIHDTKTGKPACWTRVASKALFAVSLRQGDPSGQDIADRMAVQSSNKNAFFRRAEEAIRSIAPGLDLLPHYPIRDDD